MHSMRLVRMFSMLLILFTAFVGQLHADQLQEPTHRQIRILEPKVDGKTLKLHTIATTPDGHVLAAVGGQSMQYVMNGGSYETKFVKESSYVLMLDAEGNTVKQWELDLTPSALAVTPGGDIFVGGSGRIAKLDPDGSVSVTIDSPHVGSVKDLRERTAKSIRASRLQMSEAYEGQISTLKERVRTIEEKDEDGRTRLETAQLRAFNSQLEMLEDLIGQQTEDDSVEVDDSQLDAAVLRSMSITSMAASDRDVFVCASDPSRGGYSLWRIDGDLNADSSEVIKEGLRGCCGQMDIQCCGENLLISENTKFKVGIYDRNGRSKGSFGKRDRTSRAGFGSCCNPMNSLAMSDGTVLTAESSIGHIKRFDQDGKLVAYIGKASIGGGCKHCALGYDEKNDLYYMMYEDKNSICVLGNNENTPMTLAEKKLQQSQIDFLARAAGEWAMEDTKSEKKSGPLSWFGGGRGGASQHPITAITVQPDGSANIIEGMYKVYGDKSSLELVKADAEKTDEFAFALTIDQARFLEGTWKFDADDKATLSFPGMPVVALTRSAEAEKCESGCAGKDCASPECKDENCPQTKVGVSKLAKVESPEGLEMEIEGVTQEVIDVYLEEISEAEVEQDSSFAPKTRFEYKLLSKRQLGKNAEEALNQLGAQGWDFCDMVGKKMMFKRTTVSVGEE